MLAEVPLAAVKPHLQRRKAPPRLVDGLIAKTYYAIVGVRTPETMRTAALERAKTSARLRGGELMSDNDGARSFWATGRWRRKP